MRVIALVLSALVLVVPLRSQDAPPVVVDSFHKPFDEILDTNVRDGFVYYNALRLTRGALDRYVNSLDGPAAAEQARGSREAQIAFWVNAYNAFVLQTVVTHFPIRGRASAFPANSIRQIPGVFDRQTFRAAGRSVTLDGIEKDILPPLADARTFLALGRGAVGGGRLRSEAYDAKRLHSQLDAVAAESVSRYEIVRVDIPGNLLSVTPLFSWREPAFVASYANKAKEMFGQRSALERAVLGLITPHLVGSEVAFLEKNTFHMEFHGFDWRLNDLSARSD